MKRRRWKLYLILMGTLYVFSFAVLAALGGYTLVPSGENRPHHLAVNDTWTWHPRYGTFFRYRSPSGESMRIADGAGFFYAPLIAAYRGFVRPSFSALNPPHMPPRGELHPVTASIVDRLEREGSLDWD